MFVRLWAGPSCMARAMSRRRSSWADCRRRCIAAERRAAVAPSGVPGVVAAGRARAAPSSPASVATSPRRFARRVAIARQDLLLALQDVDLGVHHGGALRERDELGVLRPRSRAVGGHAERRRASPPAGPASARGGRPRSAPAGEQLDLGRARASRPSTSRSSAAGEVGRGADGLGHPGRVSPPASGSSPGAWRRRRPGSGR